MGKYILSSLILLLIVTICGCNNDQTYSHPKKEAVKITTTKKFTAKSALRMAITHFNKVDKGKLDYKFPISKTVGKTVSKEIPIGGPVGNKTKLDFKNSVEPSGINYIVTLTEDYNYDVGGTKAISYWKYEVSSDGLKLLDKNGNGSIINIVK